MLTYKQLVDSTIKYAGRRRLNIDVDGELVSITPNVRAGLITFRFRVKSVKKRNEGYTVWLQFYNVVYGDHPLSSTSIKLIDKDTGEPLYFERLSLTNVGKKNYIRVRCACQDFRFRFAWEDRANQALYGGVPKSYQRVPGSTRPPVNPEHLPGICKHIAACMRTIEHFFCR